MLPQDVRWNTLADCLQSYLDNWPILLKVCEEHRGSIDSTVARKVQNIGIKRNAEDYLQRLKPISVALDKVQRDNCFMGQAVDAWKQLERDLEDVNQPLTVMKKVQERCSQALTPAHYLAHILDPTTAGNDLSGSEVASVMDYAAKTCPDLLPILINYRAKAEPFKEYLFSPSVVDSVTPLSWWKALPDRVGDKVMNPDIGGICLKCRGGKDLLHIWIYTLKDQEPSWHREGWQTCLHL